MISSLLVFKESYKNELYFRVSFLIFLQNLGGSYFCRKASFQGGLMLSNFLELIGIIFFPWPEYVLSDMH